jgi:hypothetical protein
MQKKKATTYLLLISVLSIWGIIAYRLVYYTADQKVDPISIAPYAGASISSYQRTKLKLNYADPFFRSGEGIELWVENERSGQRDSPQTGRRGSVAPAPAEIFYYGSIANRLRMVAVLSIATSANRMAEEGDQVGDFRILTIKKDSIQLSNNIASFWVQKQ